MRRDIEIKINSGDVSLPTTYKVVQRTLKWLDETPDGELQSYLYGEVEVPSSISEKQLFSDGIYVRLAYTPVYKLCKIRVKRVSASGDGEYVINPREGSEWFTLKASLYGSHNNTLREIYASELVLLNEQSIFLQFDSEQRTEAGIPKVYYSGCLRAYSGGSTDFNICIANHQNSNLLLKCNPGNNYRYPLSGVGLIRWTNGNLNHMKLAQIIQDEFLEDGVNVREARLNTDNNSLVLNANYDNLD